jgi:hypothetical protein
MDKREIAFFDFHSEGEGRRAVVVIEISSFCQGGTMNRLLSAASQFQGKLVLLAFNILVLIAMGGFARLSAQSLSGSITGVVTDPSGAVIPGANVALRDVN